MTKPKIVALFGKVYVWQRDKKTGQWKLSRPLGSGSGYEVESK